MRTTRIIAAIVAAAIFTVGLAAALAADSHDQGWPTTCVDLNDIVETHLGNDENVGIYQRAFGDQAEAGCRNDHRQDVRNTFSWAVGPELDAAPLSIEGGGTRHATSQSRKDCGLLLIV